MRSFEMSHFKHDRFESIIAGIFYKFEERTTAQRLKAEKCVSRLLEALLSICFIGNCNVISVFEGAFTLLDVYIVKNTSSWTVIRAILLLSRELK